MPLPIMNLKQAFAAQNVLPAALMRSENNAVFLNKNKNVNTKNKQNVSDGIKNCFMLIETMKTYFFFYADKSNLVQHQARWLRNSVVFLFT
jgi:hypothetical protein